MQDFFLQKRKEGVRRSLLVGRRGRTKGRGPTYGLRGYFRVVNLSSGKVVRTSPLKWISCGTELE
jgi:hypothetical protein